GRVLRALCRDRCDRESDGDEQRDTGDDEREAAPPDGREESLHQPRIAFRIGATIAAIAAMPAAPRMPYRVRRDTTSWDFSTRTVFCSSSRRRCSASW